MAQLLFPSLGDSAAKTAATVPLTTAGSGTVTSNKSGSTTANSTESGTATTNATNMSPQAMAALNTLIQQMLGGGTKEMAKDEAVRKGEINNVQGQRAGYSKEAAMGDAQGLISQQLRMAMEKMLPSITRAAEGSGTSGNAMRALMIQDANTRAAEASSAAGVQAAIGYGNVAGNMNNTLEALTRPNDAASNMLLNLLNIAKGAVTNSTVNTTGTKSGSGTSQESGITGTNEVKTVSPTVTSGSTPAGGMGYFGPSDPNAGKLPNDFISSALYQFNKDQFSGLTF